jgi:hypothetical protein|tara:strand:+ start:228 stop:467 length:240 start_codon:yes stop_codon:yes gene_type:complete
MTREEIKELIQSMIKEYMSTISERGNATDGNNIKSPRPFTSAADEIENYTNKNVYGAEGGHYKREPSTHNYNRTRFGKF